jgi:hypothetical protein
MILHPGILALLLGSGTVLVMTLYACGVGLEVLRGWDFRSSSERQLALERKTYLVSSIMGYALLFEIVSGLLFLYSVDDIHHLFPGAMCATGSLNANPVGWAALSLKVVIFFAASLWVVLNAVDQRAEDYPLVRGKYALLFPIAALTGGDLYLQFRYFSGLDPAVITSCCGALFSAANDTVASEVAALPVLPTMRAFYGSVLLMAGLALSCLASRAVLPRCGLLIATALFFTVSVGSVVTFISSYIYQLPTHHCPFDIIQRNYSYIGYPLYAALFTAALFGVLPGLFNPFRRIPSLTGVIERAEKKWLLTALAALGLFAALASWPIVFGSFSLLGSV